MVNRSRWTLFALALIALLLAAGLAACSDDDNGKSPDETSPTQEVTTPITVSDAWVRATIPAEGGMESGEMGRVTGAFMIISNGGSSPDTLISASVTDDIAQTVEIHETTVDTNDVMQMRPVDGVEIPAGGNAVLKPGSYHIMLLDVQRDLNPDDVVPITLTFESGITLTVDAVVRAME